MLHQILQQIKIKPKCGNSISQYKIYSFRRNRNNEANYHETITYSP